jgi:hypothetical protein
MTTDEKIDEVLRLVREQGRENELRFSRLEERDNQLLLLIQEQGERHERRFAQIDERFVQVDGNFARLEAKIDKVYDSLSQDIQIFAEDLHHVKRRVTRLEKKLVS